MIFELDYKFDLLTGTFWSFRKLIRWISPLIWAILFASQEWLILAIPFHFLHKYTIPA